jgi:hypothetical protein
VEFLPSMRIESCTMRISTCSIHSRPIGTGNRLNMYLSPWYMVQFPRKAKTLLVSRVQKIVRWQCWDHLRWWGPNCYNYHYVLCFIHR